MTKITEYPAISLPLKATDLVDISVDKGLGVFETEQATLSDISDFLPTIYSADGLTGANRRVRVTDTLKFQNSLGTKDLLYLEPNINL